MIEKSKIAYIVTICTVFGLLLLMYLGKLDIDIAFEGNSIHMTSKN